VKFRKRLLQMPTYASRILSNAFECFAGASRMPHEASWVGRHALAVRGSSHKALWRSDASLFRSQCQPSANLNRQSRIFGGVIYERVRNKSRYRKRPTAAVRGRRRAGTPPCGDAAVRGRRRAGDSTRPARSSCSCLRLPLINVSSGNEGISA